MCAFELYHAARDAIKPMVTEDRDKVINTHMTGH